MDVNVNGVKLSFKGLSGRNKMNNRPAAFVENPKPLSK
jgi:hypothetical protein